MWDFACVWFAYVWAGRVFSRCFNCTDSNLWYSNVLCGVIRGALEMVQMRVEAKFVKCALRGDDQTEIKVSFLGIIEEEIPVGDD